MYIAAEAAGTFGPVGTAYPVYLGSLITVLLLLERWMPMRPDWGMTRTLFFVRDLPMLVVNGAAMVAATHGITWLVGHRVLCSLGASGLPWPVQALIAAALADLAWYGLHRYCHEGRGRLGRWMWRTHVLHHLPEQVYVFMHAAGHPIQSAYVRIVLLLPAIGLGLTPEAAFAAAVFNGFQGLVSHFNVDIRAGWLNRVFIGTELHRFHHSADPAEARNYAAVFSVWDQLFGSYRLPGVAPAALGVPDRTAYPANTQWLQLLALPLRSASPAQRREP
ncbi:sterol desaturase [Vitreoscilla filiformis]|uniref:Sterol desaturase n=1 Tax=Vitreoscilla filiformis TaxID=63 RepID=A0A221KJ95_VITFI|nr:sterol desaturase family protein [Vitreoscilla filiformis]ASM78917.1 sterol desaturase [Vitreoscilla filiformis]